MSELNDTLHERLGIPMPDDETTRLPGQEVQ